VRFVFGYDARAKLVETAANADQDGYHDLVGRAERAIATARRARPRNHKDDVHRLAVPQLYLDYPPASHNSLCRRERGPVPVWASRMEA
jgi:hypothetical protein